MKAAQIEIGSDYEVERGYWSARHRVRILGKEGGGFWRGRCIRDKYSEGKPGDECFVESRKIIRPWAQARQELESRDIYQRAWDRSERKIESQTKDLVSRLAGFSAELDFCDTQEGPDGLPDGAVVSVAFPLEELQRLVATVEKTEPAQPQEAEESPSALLELI